MLQPRAIVIGANGQVGSALMAQLGSNAIGITRRHADIGVRMELLRALDAVGPAGLLINAAAYNAVDRAESEQIRAFAVNSDAPGWAAAWAAEHGIPYVHYSTEYVFPDSSGVPWREEDVPAPLNVYGASKLAGELAVLSAYEKSIVVRTSWVFSAQENNFLHKVLKLASTGKALHMVTDQVGSPTFAPELARATLAAVQNPSLLSRLSGKVIHLAGSGSVSRADFAREIIRVGLAEGVLTSEVAVIETTTAAMKSAARRPTHCILDCGQAAELGVGLAPWQEFLPLVIKAVRS
jgi:dTDP-4-dehydrorhamnose reductase